MSRAKDFLLAIMAGVMISIGGIVYLSMSNNVIGAALFSIGLFFVLFFGFNLYTGKVGYLVFNKPDYLVFLIIIFIGNLVGTVLVGTLVRFTRHTQLIEKAIEICKIKNGDSLISIFILSMFCGLLMFLASDNFNKSEDNARKIIGILLCVMVFILSGTEHCIANIFFYTLAGVWNFKSVMYILVMGLGNGVGGCILPLVQKFISEN